MVQRADGKVVACEVKLGPGVDDHDVGHLRWLAQRLGADLLDAVVLTTGREAYRRCTGIAVVPLGCSVPEPRAGDPRTIFGMRLTDDVIIDRVEEIAQPAAGQRG